MTENIEEYSTVAFSRKSGEKSRKSSRQPEFRRPDKKQPGISRRNLLLGAGAAVGTGILAALGVKLAIEQGKSETGPYANWEPYINRYLPREIVTAIGADINKTGYQGFAEVGKIILLSQQQPLPDSLKNLLPDMNSTVQVRLRNIARTEGAIGQFAVNTRGTAIGVEAIDKSTGEKKEGILLDAKEVRVIVELDNSFSVAPEDGKRLILVKEFSHFLYIPRLKDLLADDVLKNFEVTTKPEAKNIKDSLFLAAQLRGQFTNIPSLGDIFENAPFYLDGAGYWHIMPAFGQMKASGRFSREDLQVLWSDNWFFERAIKEKWLEGRNGQFTWKQGIGPLSPEWREVTKEFFTRGAGPVGIKFETGGLVLGIVGSASNTLQTQDV